MGHPKKITDARLKAVLKQHDGLQALTARTLGVSRQNVQQRIQRNPDLQQFIADLGVQILDTAESQVAKKVRKGDGTTVRWLLDRKGRDRGYGPRPGDMPPPPPDNSKRALIVNVLIQNLNAKAAAIHAEAHDETQGALAAPARRLNGHNPGEYPTMPVEPINT